MAMEAAGAWAWAAGRELSADVAGAVAAAETVGVASAAGVVAGPGPGTGCGCGDSSKGTPAQRLTRLAHKLRSVLQYGKRCRGTVAVVFVTFVVFVEGPWYVGNGDMKWVGRGRREQRTSGSPHPHPPLGPLSASSLQPIPLN